MKSTRAGGPAVGAGLAPARPLVHVPGRNQREGPQPLPFVVSIREVLRRGRNRNLPLLSVIFFGCFLLDKQKKVAPSPRSAERSEVFCKVLLAKYVTPNTKKERSEDRSFFVLALTYFPGSSPSKYRRHW